jgi:hypothetical protein
MERCFTARVSPRLKGRVPLHGEATNAAKRNATKAVVVVVVVVVVASLPQNPLPLHKE